MRRTRFTLGQKAIFSIIIILSPILIGGLLSYRHIYDHVRESGLADLWMLAETYGAYVKEFTSANKRRAEDFASDGVIKKEAALLSAGAGDPSVLVEHLRRNKLPLDGDIKRISVASLSGRIVASTEAKEIGRDVSGEAFFKAGGKGSVFAETDSGGGFVAVVPISDGKPVGVLINHIDKAALERLLGDVMSGLEHVTAKTTMGNAIEVAVVNDKGSFIVDSSHAKDALFREALISGPVAMCVGSESDKADFYTDSRGKIVAGASTCLGDTGWTVLAMTDDAAFTAAMDDVRVHAAIVIALVSGAIVIIFWLFSRKTLSQVDMLYSGALRVASGDYRVSMPARSTDELGELSEAFTRMASEINTRAAALERSMKNLADAQRTARLGSWAWDIRNDSVEWSDEAYRIFGKTPQSIAVSYEDFIEVVHPGDRDVVRRAVNAALERGTLYAIDHRVRLSDGTERIVHEKGRVTFEGGVAVSMSGTVQDITERKRAEEAVQKSNALLEIIGRTQSAFISAGSDRAVFEEALGNVLDLTGSDLGLIIEMWRETGVRPLIKVAASRSSHEFVKSLFERKEVSDGGMPFTMTDSLIAMVAEAGGPVVVNEPPHGRHAGMPANHPGIANFLGLPIIARSGETVGMIGLANRPGGYDKEIAGLLKPFAYTCGNIMKAARDSERRVLVEAELHELVARQTNMEEESRKHFSELLHEGIGQNLAAIKLAIMGCFKGMVDAEKSADLEKIVSMLDDTIRSTREMTAELYPAIVDEMGFESAVRWYLKSVVEANGLAVFAAMDLSDAPLCKEDERVLFRICRESFQNIMKHAAATRVDLECFVDGARVALKIKDNGAGFAAKALPGDKRRGIGLTLMREWLHSMGGSLTVNSAPGKGTEVVADVPLSTRERGALLL